MLDEVSEYEEKQRGELETRVELGRGVRGCIWREEAGREMRDILRDLGGCEAVLMGRGMDGE